MPERRTHGARTPRAEGARDDAPRAPHRALPHPDRARQFVPFAALKGYYELLRAQEAPAEPRHVLVEEEAYELATRLGALAKGAVVRVVYYAHDRYATLAGRCESIDYAQRMLTVSAQRIAFDDIRTLELLE